MIGGTIPGIPAVMVGRSDALGWGLTTAYVDDQDVVIEELPKEKLTIAGKSVEARVFRRRSEDGTRVTTLWMDPAQAYLTVQALHRDEGNTYRLNWLGN